MKDANLIKYQRFNELVEWIQECKEESEEGNEPVCMALQGQTGAGKSTLVQTYAKLYPIRYIEHRTEIPVFYMQTPSPVTIKNMASEMLNHLGDPAAHKGTVGEMNTKLVRYLSDCKVELVILDDFHHLIDKKTNRVLSEVSDWLKVLIKRTNIPFLITGVDNQVQRILKQNAQLSRLFMRERLKPFVWDAKQPETIKNFAACIVFIEKTLEIKLPRKVERFELLYRIHYATNGVMGYIMYLLRKAKRISHKRELYGHISLKILAQAFEQRLQEHVEKANPFLLAGDKSFVPPSVGVVLDDPQGTTNRGGRRKKKEPNASEVLKTS